MPPGRGKKRRASSSPRSASGYEKRSEYLQEFLETVEHECNQLASKAAPTETKSPGNSDVPVFVPASALVSRLRSLLYSDNSGLTVQASEMPLNGVLDTFKLDFETEELCVDGHEPKYQWDITKKLSNLEIATQEHVKALKILLNGYMECFDMGMEQTRRTLVDLVLHTALIGLKKQSATELSTALSEPSTPGTSIKSVKIHGEVMVKHEVLRKKGEEKVTLQGRADYGIGIAASYKPTASALTNRKRSFQSMLLIVEAKRVLADGEAQLLAYLGALRQTRQRKGRQNVTVYGLLSDGFSYRFYCIEQSGKVVKSDGFGIRTADGIHTIVGALQYVIKAACSLSPNTTPEPDLQNIEEEETLDVGFEVEYPAPSRDLEEEDSEEE